MNCFGFSQRVLSMAVALLAILLTGCGGSSNDLGNSKLPQIATVTPSLAPTSGPTTVTVTGKNFSNSTSLVQVVFGQDAATSVTVVSDTQITAVAPAKATGDVRVTTSNGTSPQTTADIFYGYSPPV